MMRTEQGGTLRGCERERQKAPEWELHMALAGYQHPRPGACSV